METSKFAIVDGDNIVFKACCAIERRQWQFKHEDGRVEIFPGLTKYEVLENLNKNPEEYKGSLQKTRLIVGSEDDAIHNARRLMERLYKRYPGREPVVCLGDPNTPDFRRKIAKRIAYKSSRKNKPKPHYFWEVRLYLTQEWETSIIPGIEADDDMGIIAGHNPNGVMCTIDKDLDMIPGFHYNYDTGREYFTDYKGSLELRVPNGNTGRKVLRGGGVKWFYAQMLLGDSADDIPHMKGYGPVKVYNLLKDVDDEKEMFKVVYNEYKKSTLGRQLGTNLNEYIFELADLLWIRQENDQWKSKELESWIHS